MSDPTPREIKLSGPALEVLRLMRDSGSTLDYEHGTGYVGNRRVKQAPRILMELIYAMMVRRVGHTGSTTEYYRIGPEGLAALRAVEGK